MDRKRKKEVILPLFQITPELEEGLIFDPTAEIEEGVYIGQILEKCHRLTNRERFVIFSRMGFGECAGLTQRELAKRLGVCPARISDMKIKATRKILNWFYIQNRTEADKV